ncbi:hypothetical protein [Brochothrix phage ADU4]|uniref:Gp73 n=1 Tax=Brochothrix phage A9 TaxID=857312 RepID=D9J0M0_9CAUD|nr:terminase small subunit [Brochothrix phage A9]ADJ53113.1 gp73 [Brochothrix phage A9]UKM96406.1 hypothetical protein [Brochothrix phage ADU4]
MSMADNIKEKATKKQQVSQAEVAQTFSDIASATLSKFLENMTAGKIEVTDLVDVQRIYVMWKEMVGYQDMLAGGAGDGQLPEIKSGEMRALEEAGVIGDEETLVNLEELSPEKIQAVADSIMQQHNDENAGTF